MRLGLGLGVDSITSQKIGAGFTGILDEYSGAAAAYSVRRLSSTYTDGLIRVRRSSDDTEQDIGFDANGDLDTTALTTFVNADVNQYTSDFSSTEDLGETNGTGAAAQSVGGVDDAYKFTTITGTGQMFANVSPFSGKGGGNSFRVQADVYLPSTNAEIDKVRIWTGYGSEIFADITDTDTWTSIDQTITITSGSNLRFQAVDGSDITPTTTGANVFYLKNIVVTQTTADGAVTTFYDQSGNGNNATNSTESEQPLVVSGGALVEENGKAAIDFDGVDDTFDSASFLNALDDASIISVSSPIATNAFSNIYSGFDSFSLYNILFRYSDDSKVFVGLSGLSASENYSTSTSYAAQQNLIFVNFDNSLTAGNQVDIYLNGSDANASGSNDVGTLKSPTNGYIGSRSGANEFNGNMQELIFFASEQSSNRQDIEKNIADYYDITLSGNAGVESWVKNVSFADMYQSWYDYEYLHRLFANFEIPNKVFKVLAYTSELTADQRQQVYDYLQKNYHPIYTPYSTRVLADGGTLAAGQTNTLTIIDSI